MKVTSEKSAIIP